MYPPPMFLATRHLDHPLLSLFESSTTITCHPAFAVVQGLDLALLPPLGDEHPS